MTRYAVTLHPRLADNSVDADSPEEAVEIMHKRLLEALHGEPEFVVVSARNLLGYYKVESDGTLVKTA